MNATEKHFALSKPYTRNPSEMTVVIFSENAAGMTMQKYHTWSDALVRGVSITAEDARTEWTRLVRNGFKRNAAIEHGVANR